MRHRCCGVMNVMPRKERTGNLFFDVLIDSMAAAFSMYAPPVTLHQKSHKSDTQALRGDWVEIGNDFRAAIGKAASQSDEEHRKAA